MKDKSGREIKPGDFILYGQSQGRSAGLNYGRVLSLSLRKGFRARRTRMVCFVGMRRWFWDGSCLQKPSYLQNGDSILVISKKQLDAGARKWLCGDLKKLKEKALNES